MATTARNYQLYIGGAWVDPSSDDELDVVNPATEDTIGRVPQASVADVDRAVPSARGLGQGVILKEPVGVVAAITPFNFPLYLNLSKVVPALAMGNTVVLKPSPYTPLEAFVLGEIADAAELPPGVLNVVTGDVAAGEHLTTHPDVDMISFTGSDFVGKKIMSQAAEGLKKILLELGGKSPNIIFAGADVKR